VVWSVENQLALAWRWHEVGREEARPMTTYDPFRVLERPKLGLFEGLSSPPPGSVFVVDRVGRPLRALEGPTERLTRKDLRLAHVRTLYEVDVTEHHLEFQDTMPCMDDVGGFQARVKFTCSVRDAAEVVRRGTHDVARVMVPLLTETLRRSCYQFNAEEASRAEDAGRLAIEGVEAREGHHPAFTVSNVLLVLELDEAAAQHVRERKARKRDRERQIDLAQLEVEKARLLAEQERITRAIEEERSEFGRKQDERKTQAAADLELKRLDFELQRQHKQAEIDAQRIKLELARLALESEYELTYLTARLEREDKQVRQIITHLAAGDYGGIALQLIQDPTAIASVVAWQAMQADSVVERQLDTLRLLLERGALEGSGVTDEAKTVLNQLIERWLQSLGGPPQEALPAETRTRDAQLGPSPTSNSTSEASPEPAPQG
jgi:hypothetical protein